MTANDTKFNDLLAVNNNLIGLGMCIAPLNILRVALLGKVYFLSELVVAHKMNMNMEHFLAT